jgi:hypothetical protein
MLNNYSLKVKVRETPPCNDGASSDFVKKEAGDKNLLGDLNPCSF